MPRRAYILLFLLFLVLFGLALPLPARAEPQVVGEAAVLMDLDSGRVLWSKNPDRQMPIASTTKILTALVALEKGKLDQKLKASFDAVRVDGTRVYLVEGEEHTLEDLLYAMLLNSANDAALTIAEGLAGSREKFAGWMNERAIQAGARNSHFVNPHGLDEEGHYSTARDLGLIAVAAMQNPVFREIVATRSRPWQGQEWQSTLVNHNKLLGQYEGAIGVKTGYTSKAGQCVVAAARRGEEAYLAVVLNSQGSALWSDARALLDYGFASFQAVPLARRGQVLARMRVPRAGEVPLLADRSLSYLASGGGEELPDLEVQLSVPPAGAAKGEQLGEAVFSLQGREVGRVPLVAGRSIPRRASWLEWWGGISAALALLWLADRLLWRSRRRRRWRRIYR